MRDRSRNQEIQLVDRCVAGDQQAWDEFYRQYVCLIRNIVRRKLRIASHDVEDIVQMVFGDLVPALKTYDGAVSITRYIVIITERTCINEYQKSTAGKRHGTSFPIDHHDGDDEGTWRLASNLDSPEDHLEQEQLKEVLRKALWELDEECSKILTLREFKALPWKQISEVLGKRENTLTVKLKRCMDDLKVLCHRLIRKGCKR